MNTQRNTSSSDSVALTSWRMKGIGAAIIYVLVFAGLFLASAGLYWGVDRYLARLLVRFKFLASGASNLPVNRQAMTASSQKS